MSKYDENLKETFEILKNTKLDELLQIAVEAMNDAVVDIEMEANQKWHAKITLETALMVISEKLSNQNRHTIDEV